MNPNQPDALRAPGPFSMRTNAPHFPSKPASNKSASRLIQPAESGSACSDTPLSPDSFDALTDLVTHLTPRRFEVLEFVARGLTNREIAKVMGISTNTVKAHVTGVLETLDLTNRTEAAIALQAYESERTQRAR